MCEFNSCKQHIKEEKLLTFLYWTECELVLLMECEPAEAAGDSFGNTELSQKEVQIKTQHSLELDDEGEKISG